MARSLCGTLRGKQLKEISFFNFPGLIFIFFISLQAQIKGSHTHPRLKLDLPTGTYVPLFPNFSKLTWKEAWEQATQAL